jgi:hypothetical protein
MSRQNFFKELSVSWILLGQPRGPDEEHFVDDIFRAGGIGLIELGSSARQEVLILRGQAPFWRRVSVTGADCRNGVEIDYGDWLLMQNSGYSRK